jgi:peroxiredoxin/uncharacterized membrane protein YphA (DoxX/SURF4 family)
VSGTALAARLALAVVFGLAGVAKLADLEGSRRALEGFGAPARLARVGGSALPVLELLVAIGLIVPAAAWWAAIAAAGMLALFIVAICVSIARGVEPDCHCFGQVHSEPAGWRTLVRNVLLLAITAVVIAAGRGDSSLNPVGWVAELSVAEIVLSAFAAVLAGVAVGQGWFLLELLRQNGRILSRLERLESSGASLDNGPQIGANGDRQPPGLAVGTPAPAFTLSALGGERVSLADLLARERPVVLLFSDPGCGPCNALLPDIAAWQHEHRELTLALLSRGAIDQNKAKAGEHGLTWVLLQTDREVAESYQAHGTPAAVLVSLDGRIGSPLALGPQAIADLVGSATVLPSEVRQPNSEAWPVAAPVAIAVGNRAPEPHQAEGAC